MSRRTLAVLDGLGVIALVGLWCAILVPLVSTAASDVRVLGAFQTDEVVQVNLLGGALRDHTFALRYGSYPHLYFNIALIALRILGLGRAVTEQDVAITLRTICVVSGAATLGLVFVWARREYGRLAAWFAIAALALNPMIFTWAIYAHPDTLQLFFLLLALFASASYYEHPTRRALLLASAVAGLAFACKYAGVAVLGLLWPIALWRSPVQDSTAWPSRTFRIATAILAVFCIVASYWLDVPHVAALMTDDGQLDIPAPEHVVATARWAVDVLGAVLLAAVFWPGCWAALEHARRMRTVLRAMTESTAAFVTAFAVASPFSFLHFAVVNGIVYHILQEGLRNQALTTRWASFVFDDLGYGIPILAAACAVWILADIVRGRPRSGTDVVLLMWTTLFAGILVLPVHLVQPHHMLPMIPALIMMASRCLSDIATVLRARFHGIGRPATAAAFGVIALVVLVPFASRFRVDRRQALDRERTSNAIWAGEWLRCHVPPSTRIAYDQISYVPAVFEQVTPTWNGSLAWLRRTDPDIVIVNHLTTDQFRGDRQAGDYYRCLEDGTCGFRWIVSRGEIDVYARPERVRPALAVSSRCRGIS